jgi:probable HAF family extracellular repeat protein
MTSLARPSFFLRGAKSGTEAFGINDAGQIVGQYQDATGTHGFLLSGGISTTLDDPLATGGTFAQGISAAVKTRIHDIF